jgi:hypothetical protein
MTNHERAPFDGLRPTGAPAHLRGRVLDAARQAALAPPAPTLWDRLFESRPLRAAWVGACAVLAAAHLALTALPPQPEPTAPTLADAPELRELLELPRQHSDVQLGLGATLPPAEPGPPEGEGRPLDEGVPS